jgi:hypothetical protein
MSDMDGFLSKVVTESLDGANRQSRDMDGIKLIGQRNINIAQQQQIIENQRYILELKSTIESLKSQNRALAQEIESLRDEVDPTDGYDPFAAGFGFPGQNVKGVIARAKAEAVEETRSAYEALLSKSFFEIAQENRNFSATYVQNMEELADWIVSQKAFKELAIQFGFRAHGYAPEQVIEMGKDKKIDVLEDKHNPRHNTNAGDSNLTYYKDKLAEKYRQDKAMRSNKKGS